MRRHELDWVSLIAGIVFLGIAAVYAVAALAGASINVDGRFVWPVVFVALGAAGVATAVTATAREEQAFTAPKPEDQQQS